MRIGLVSMEYPPETAFGGIATYSQTLARELRRLGHDVDVVSATLGDHARLEDDRGVRVFRFALPKFPVPFASRFLPGTCRDLRFAWVASRAVRRLHRERAFDVIEAPEWGASALFLGVASPAPLLVRLHAHLAMVLAENGERRGVDERVRCLLESIACRRADRLVANSDGLRRRIAADYGLRAESIAVLPCPLEPDAFTSDAMTPASADDAPASVLYAGRIEERKGVRLLLDAMKQVWQEHPKVKLVLAGRDTRSARIDGSLRLHLETEARAAGKSDCVAFLGELPRSAMRGVYDSADLFVTPAPFEALGYTTLEAMAAGKPVVGSRGGGTPEVVRDGETGVLVPPGDSRALGRAISKLLSDRPLRKRLGDQARHDARRRFGATSIAERMVEEYRAALAKRGTQRKTADPVERVPFEDLFPRLEGRARESLRRWLRHVSPLVDSHPWKHYFIAEARQVLDLVEFESDTAATRVLEPGSGHGLVGSLLALLGAEVWLLDTDRRALDEGIEHARALGVASRVHPVLADLFKMPFADATFDVVWNDGVIEHFDDPSACVREMARVTRPAGRVALLVPQRRTLHTWYVRGRQRRRNDFHFDDWGRERSYSPRDLERLFAGAGLDDVRVSAGNLRRAILDDWVVLPRLQDWISRRHVVDLMHVLDRIESSIDVLSELGFAATATGRKPTAEPSLRPEHS
ncbi:MAG: glycosyltransferase [Planctomycetes bacterium]|nr:glycosyltransferase [Planctomycetota bacterium]MBI3846255.1 glycosyltransferase [Planctomycetota bacterium]